MQVLQAGQHKFIYLELQPEMVASIARQAGFETRVKDSRRTIHLDLSAPAREGPLLLFDAADPANLGWFSRCQFYVVGAPGTIIKTPLRRAISAIAAARRSLTPCASASARNCPPPSAYPATSR